MLYQLTIVPDSTKEPFFPSMVGPSPPSSTGKPLAGLVDLLNDVAASS